MGENSSTQIRANRFIGAVNGERIFSIMGSFGELHLPPQPISAIINASVTQDGPTILFNSLEFRLPSFTFETTSKFSAGLGKMVNAILRLTLDESLISFSSLRPFPLATNNRGTYSLIMPVEGLEINRTIYPKELSMDIKGVYELTGPTQEKRGTFSKRRTIYRHNDNPTWRLDAASYPSSVLLLDRNVIQWVSAFVPYVADVEVDGVKIFVSSGGENWSFNTPILLSPTSSTAVVIPTLDKPKIPDTPKKLILPIAASAIGPKKVVSVELKEQEETIYVRGKLKKWPSPTTLRIIKAIIKAKSEGLHRLQGPELDRKSSTTDARKILKELARLDEDWREVLIFPTGKGTGYGIK